MTIKFNNGGEKKLSRKSSFMHNNHITWLLNSTKQCYTIVLWIVFFRSFFSLVKSTAPNSNTSPKHMRRKEFARKNKPTNWVKRKFIPEYTDLIEPKRHTIIRCLRNTTSKRLKKMETLVSGTHINISISARATERERFNVFYIIYVLFCAIVVIMHFAAETT